MREYFEVFGFVIFTALGIAQLVAGYVGIEPYLGNILSFVVVLLFLVLRFTLPISICAFFGAMNVWEWHWTVAALFAAPGLLFMMPGILAPVFSFIKNRAT